MSHAISRRLGRRMTAMGAGAALVAAGLSLGVMAPANAASSVLTGGVTDAFGNPLSGAVSVYQRDPADGSFDYTFTIGVDNTGFIEDSLFDGTYKFAFNTGSFTEYYKDKADLTTSEAVVVAAGAPVSLGSWTVDQPYVVGSVTNAAGKPLAGTSIQVYDAATSNDRGSFSVDEKGNFKIATQAAPVKLGFYSDGYAYEYFNDKGTLAAADPVTGTAAGAGPVAVVMGPGGTVTGQVTSDAGAPLEFIRVSVDGGQSDVTDKNGVYTVKGVGTGSHLVRFSDPIGEYASEYYNNAPTSATATPVVVGADQVVPGINANVTPLPVDTTKTVELTGTVRDSIGAPVVGASVSAFTTPASSSDRQVVESVYSNRQGVYRFTELEKVQNENQFKVFAGANEQGDDSAFDLYSSWFGGGHQYDLAPAVTVTPGTPVGAVDFTLERAGGISGSVTGLAGTPLSPSVSLLGPVDGVYGDAYYTFKPDSTFESRSVRPGTYKVYFDDYSGFHAGEWWQDTSKVEDALVITVKPGQMITGLNAVLGNKLFASERPEIKAYPWVGKALSADSGEWNLQTGTAFKYEWLVGTTVVGKGDTFTPTSALIGDRLTLRVSAENGRLIGSATSAATAKVGYQPKVKIKVKGATASLKVKANPVKAKKIKGTVIVKEIVKVKDDGTIKYKLVAKGKIKKGKGTISLSKLKKGKHKLVFFFTGKGKVGSTEVKKKVKR
jgi:hypothetical protein